MVNHENYETRVIFQYIEHQVQENILHLFRHHSFL